MKTIFTNKVFFKKIDKPISFQLLLLTMSFSSLNTKANKMKKILLISILLNLIFNTTIYSQDPLKQEDFSATKNVYSQNVDLIGGWQGEWSKAGGYYYTFDLNLGEDIKGNIDGKCMWKLIKSPRANEQKKNRVNSRSSHHRFV